METKFFKEIQKKMNVKTLKDFEKELRKKKLEMSLKLKEKPIPILKVLFAIESQLWENIKNGGYGWIEIDRERKERLFQLIKFIRVI